MLVTWASGFAQDTETIDLTKQGFENSDEVSAVTGTDVQLSFAKGQSSANPPKYYTNKDGNAVRLYKDGTLKISSTSKKIEKIVFTIVKSKGELKPNFFSEGKYTPTSFIWEGSTNDLTITVSNVVWFQKLEITYAASSKTLKSLAISGEPTKKAYNDGDVFDPTGLVVTGTYDDASTETIKDGITWATTPATLTVGTTSCSVTATVNRVTSPAHEVTGLTVTKAITLSIDPATSTVVKAPVKVSLTATHGATIYYTLNGDEPTTTSTKYDAPFEVTKSGTTVKALAVADGIENATAKATYTIKPEQPVFSDESKTFSDAFDVTLSLPESTDATSTIHYVIGKTATAESPLYEGPINISAEKDGVKVILHAVVVDQYGNVGKEKYCTYTKTTAFVFDFTGDWEGITPQKENQNKTAANVVAGKELKVGGIVMTATNGSSLTTCLYGTKNSHNLRVYNSGGSITFTAPEGYNISEVVFDGNDTKNFSASEKSYTNPKWIGNAHAVKFTVTNSSVQLNKATIKLVATSLDLSEAETAEEITKKLTESNGKTIDVKLTRTLTANVWNTICLPFDVTAEQIAEVLKSAGNVKEYGGEEVATSTIKFNDATTMVAGKPYLIKPTENATTLVFKGVTITATKAGHNEGEQFGIYGTFGKYAMKTNGTELFLKTDGKFYVPKVGKETMNGFRAYFFNLLGDTAGAALNLSFGEATGIDGVAADAEKNVKVYNVNGQYVGTSLDALPKGLYIVGGKKVLK